MAMQILDPASDGGRGPVLIGTDTGVPGMACDVPSLVHRVLGNARGLPAAGAV